MNNDLGYNNHNSYPNQAGGGSNVFIGGNNNPNNFPFNSGGSNVFIGTSNACTAGTFGSGPCLNGGVYKYIIL
jgi:hypothetical protein